MSSSVSGVTGTQGQQTTTGYDAFENLDVSTFIDLLVAELAHQDPLNPMDNNDILQQVSQIREIQSNASLTETLESVLLGQNMSTASALIGQRIVGLDSKGEAVTGEVERVSVVDGVPTLHVGEHEVSIENITSILPQITDTASES